MVGLTGAPGAGKSTLIDRLIEVFRARGLSVAAVAVDPSSPFTGGALLGDRVRMQDHVSDPGVYMRSMSSRGHLGGVADATAKVVAVLDAVDFDVVVVETVGVGQSEVEVAEISDTTLVLLTPGTGDDIQAAKAGLLEIGSVFVVHKSDLAGADDAVRYLTQMLEMSADESEPEVVKVSSKDGAGLDDLVAAMDRHRRTVEADPSIRARRVESMLRRAVVASLARRVAGADLPPEVVDDVVARRTDPWSAATSLTSADWTRQRSTDEQPATRDWRPATVSDISGADVELGLGGSQAGDRDTRG